MKDRKSEIWKALKIAENVNKKKRKKWFPFIKDNNLSTEEKSRDFVRRGHPLDHLSNNFP